MAHLKLLKRLLVCAVAYAQIAGASEPLDPSEKRTWILRFEGIPVASLASAGASAEIQRKHHLGLSQRLADPESLLKAMGLTVTYRYTRLAVGLQVVATAHQIRDAMARTDWSPRLLGASLNTILHPMMDDSAPHIGADTAWELYGLQGEGITIGIIDSGVDYLHASFEGVADIAAYEANDGTTIEDTFGENDVPMFPTPAVVGGWDFTGPNYNPGMTPVPDPDPMPDVNDNGDYADHGTHVAGTAAARPAGVIAPGIAPAASIYALKVSSFGATDVMPAAVEWASDPNQDGDLSDRLDVLNISLGSSYAGLPSLNTMSEQDIIANYISIGGLVAAAAGNEGDKPFIHSSPGSIPGVVGVANSHASGETEGQVEVTGPEALLATHPAVEANFEFTIKLEDTGPISGPLVHIGKACDPDTIPDLTGAIALLERKECSFVEKFTHAAQKGALAVVVVHHKDNHPNKINGDQYQTIPGITVWKEVGQGLIDALTDGEAITVTLTSQPKNELNDMIWDPSSRGPAHTPTGLTAKPDVTAPGVDIGSVQSGAPLDAKNASGTSMSSPHVAGVLALLRQAHPGWSEAAIRAALMNTCQPKIMQGEIVADLTRQGAGLVSVPEAVSTNLLVSGGPSVTLDLGLISVFEPVTVTRQITIENTANVPRTLSLKVEAPTLTGVTLNVPESVIIEPNDTTVVTATFNIEPSELPMWPLRNGRPDEWVLSERDLVSSVEYSARIIVESDDGMTATLPVWMLPKRVSNTTTNLTDCAPKPNEVLELTETTERGQTEIFTLVATDERDESIHAFADIAATGIRLRSIDGETFLEFAFAMHGARTMPDEMMVATWVDYTGDNVADMVISHFDEGYIDGDRPNDRESALTLSLQDLVGDGVADIGIPAGFFDIIDKRFAYVDIDARTIVLPVPVTALPVMPEQLTFWTLSWNRYGVLTGSNSAVDSSPNVGPLLNPATAPQRHTVRLDCGLWTGPASIEVIDTVALHDLGTPACGAPGLLLLHNNASDNDYSILDAGSVDLTAQCPADVIITTPTTACTGVYTAPENPEPEGCTSGYTTTIKDDLDWPVGEHQSVLLLEDEWGATASCEVVLKVIDTTAPQLEIEKGPATSDTITWNIVTSDACGATWNVEADCGPVCKLAPTDDQLTISALPDSTPVTITVTSTDPSGNTIVEVATAMTAPLPYEETEINGTDESDGTAVVASTPKGAPGCVMYVPTSETPYVVLLLLAGLALLQKRRPVA